MIDDKKTKKQLIEELAELRREVFELAEHQGSRKDRLFKERQFQRAEEISQVGSFVVDVSSGEMKWSNQVYRMLGLEPGEIKPDNESFWEFVHPEDRDRLAQETSRVFAGTADMDVQYRIVKKDGELRHIHTHADRELDGQGNLVYIWGFSQDITESRWAIERLQESEETLRALINAPTETAILVNLKGTVLAINMPAAKRLGKKTHEMVGACIWDCLPDNLRASRQAILEKVALTGQPIRFQDERAGRIYDNNCYPVFDLEGKTKALAVYASDITEQRKAEQELRKSEEKYRTLLDSSPYGFEVIDVDGNILYSNPAYQKMVGYSEGELLGKVYSGLT